MPILAPRVTILPEPIDTAVYQPVTLIHRIFGLTSPTGKVFLAGFGDDFQAMSESDEVVLIDQSTGRRQLDQSLLPLDPEL